MKKIISVLLVIILLLGCFSACSSENKEIAAKDEKIQIVTTIFPEYDWVMEVLGENEEDFDVTLLLDSGVDLHSYQPTVDDILKISSCDLLIYVGGVSDKWVDDALKEATNKDMIVINLMDILGESVKEEEVVEGMQETEHKHEHENEHKHEHEHENEHHHYDEHVWLSLKNASKFVEAISKALQEIDEVRAEIYKLNASAYIEKLKALDEEYEAAVSSASVKTLLFGDRFPFRYLVDDYGLSYYAAFIGCSAESEASFETITFLAQKLDELSLGAVMTIEGSDNKIAKTIIDNTLSKDQQILTMDSMQSTGTKEIQDGATYLSIMENNLTVLKEALK